MEEESQERTLVVINEKEPSSSSTIQQFIWGNEIITHEQHVEVQLVQQKIENFQIINYFAQVIEGKLTKVTEIQIQNKVIKIIDIFTTKTPLKPKNLCQVSRQQQNGARKVRDLKRLTNTKISKIDKQPDLQGRHFLKTIFGLFRHWVQQNQPTSAQGNSFHLEMIQKPHLDQRYIIQISKDAVLRRLFLKFSEEKANSIIQNASVRDKQLLRQTLLEYKRICNDEDLKSQKKQQKLF